MRRILPVMALAALAFSGAGFVQAQDSNSDNAKLKTAAEDRTPATQVDFAAELQVPLQALATLGEQIERAREQADPVALASAAKTLAAAESVASDRKASITSSQLLGEACELAELRNNSLELAALASMTNGDASADLRERSEAAKAAENAAKQAAEEGEKQKDLNGDLHVMNETHEYIRLYIDGHDVGYIAPHGHRSFHVHGGFHLVGQSRYHRWHEDINGHHHHYDWVLHDPHAPHPHP